MFESKMKIYNDQAKSTHFGYRPLCLNVYSAGQSLRTSIFPKFWTLTLRTLGTPHTENMVDTTDPKQLEHQEMDVLSVRLLATNPGSPHITSQTKSSVTFIFLSAPNQHVSQSKYSYVNKSL